MCSPLGLKQELLIISDIAANRSNKIVKAVTSSTETDNLMKTFLKDFILFRDIFQRFIVNIQILENHDNAQLLLFDNVSLTFNYFQKIF